MNEVKRYCVYCGNEFMATNAWHKFCSRNCKESKRRRIKGLILDAGRYCRQCGIKFHPNSANQQHCSSECSAISARQSRSKFFKNNPDRVSIYREKTKVKLGRDGNLKRLYKRYPDLPKKCQSCGEDRVLDIAHRPNHKRNGEWRSVKNTTPDKIWILCPTCHALIDRMNYNPEELGLE